MAWLKNNSARALETDGPPSYDAIVGTLRFDSNTSILYISVGPSQWLGYSFDISHKCVTSSGSIEIEGDAESDYTHNFNHSVVGSINLSGDAESVEENNYYKTGSGSIEIEGISVSEMEGAE